MLSVREFTTVSYLLPASRKRPAGSPTCGMKRCSRSHSDRCNRPARPSKTASPMRCCLLDLYAALQCFDQITGATTVDDILANIFSSFCIGK